MTEDFRPNPFAAVVAGAVFLGSIDAFIVAVPSAAASLWWPGPRIGVGQWTFYATATGVGGAVLRALATRPLVWGQRTNNPYGASVAFNALAAPAVVGALVGWLVGGSPWAVVGAACAVIGFLPEFLITQPWKFFIDDEAQRQQSKEFAKITRRLGREYRDDLRELSLQRAQKKHDKNQERLRRQRDGT